MVKQTAMLLITLSILQMHCPSIVIPVEPVTGKATEDTLSKEYYVCQVVDGRIVVYPSFDEMRTYKRMTSTPMAAAEFAGFIDISAYEQKHIIVHASDGLVSGNTLSGAAIILQLSDAEAKRIKGMAAAIEQSKEIQELIKRQKQKSNKAL